MNFEKKKKKTSAFLWIKIKEEDIQLNKKYKFGFWLKKDKNAKVITGNSFHIALQM